MASIAIAFTVCFSIATFSYSHYAKTNQILPADITSLYAVKGREQPAVRNIPRADNSMLLHEWFGKSRGNIKIVSVTGISWLLNDQKNDLQDAINRIPVSLFIVDYTEELGWCRAKPRGVP